MPRLAVDPLACVLASYLLWSASASRRRLIRQITHTAALSSPPAAYTVPAD